MPAATRNPLFSKTVQDDSGAQPASSSMDTGPPSQGEVDHLPPPSAEVKNERNWASILPVSLHGVDPQKV